MNRKAFTLIELLIVVAIIAILAAIAVPNFLEAQTRAKVSRQYSNMRTAATAVEAYVVDHNRVPVVTANSPGVGGTAAEANYGTKPSGSWLAEETWKFYPGYADSAAGLTTPIAYITSVDALEDIFRLPLNFDSPLARQIMYLPSDHYKGGNIFGPQTNRYGSWVVRSAGPDNYYQNYFDQKGDYGAGGWNRASYDPTNGTLSAGDIYRSQRSSQESHTGP